MKTYLKQVEEARLVIEHDSDPESPRRLDQSVGFFLTKESKYRSPDGVEHPLYTIMNEMAEDATSTEHHIELMKGVASQQGIKIYEIYPVYRYEHGNVVYRRGTANGFDVSNCGFFFVTEESYMALGIDTEEIEKTIDQELETYTSWANGEVYRFTLYDENGVEEENLGGIYDIEDIHGYLPKEWEKEDLTQYVKHH